MRADIHTRTHTHIQTSTLIDNKKCLKLAARNRNEERLRYNSMPAPLALADHFRDNSPGVCLYKCPDAMAPRYIWLTTPNRWPTALVALDCDASHCVTWLFRTQGRHAITVMASLCGITSLLCCDWVPILTILQ